MVSRYHFPLKESPLISFPGKELDQMKLGHLEAPEGRQLTRRRLLFGSTEGVSWNIHGSSTVVATQSGIRHKGPCRAMWMNCWFSQQIKADKTEPLVTTAVGGMDGTHMVLSVWARSPLYGRQERAGLAVLLSRWSSCLGLQLLRGGAWVREGILKCWWCSPWLVRAPVQSVKIHWGGNSLCAPFRITFSLTKTSLKSAQDTT